MACAGTSLPSFVLPRLRERELHPLLLVAFRESLRKRLSSSRFVLRLATVQALCNLARVVLELQCPYEVCVPLGVSLSTQFTTLHFVMMCFNTDLPSWRHVLELFLREDVSHRKAVLLRTVLGEFQIGTNILSRCSCSIVLLVLCKSTRHSSVLSSPHVLSGFPRHLLYQSHHAPDGIHSTSSLRGRGFDTRHPCSH